MPDDMVKTEVHFAKNSHGSVYLYDAAENEIEQIDFDIPWDVPDDQVQPVELAVEDQTFRSFLVSGVCRIIRVCALTEEDHQTYQNNANLPNHLQTQVEENWGRHTAQILHPNKYYRLQVETSASRKKGSGDWAEETFIEYMYFKTGNPPGPLSELQLAVPAEERYDREESLKDLTAYVAYTIPAGRLPTRRSRSSIARMMSVSSITIPTSTRCIKWRTYRLRSGFWTTTTGLF
jgi:hypothetical protein